MEKVFRMHVKKYLMERIKGVISVYIIEDTLVITIQSVGRSTWQYTISNIAAQMSTSLTSRIVASVIAKEYEKYILSLYFHTK